MSRHKTSIYNGLVRSKVKEPDLKPRQLTSRQIIYLRYQCAIENKDFETAEALKILISPADKKTEISTARQKAEQLFSKPKT